MHSQGVSYEPNKRKGHGGAFQISNWSRIESEIKGGVKLAGAFLHPTKRHTLFKLSPAAMSDGERTVRCSVQHPIVPSSALFPHKDNPLTFYQTISFRDLSSTLYSLYYALIYSVKLATAPFDSRFPTTNQCVTNVVARSSFEFH